MKRLVFCATVAAAGVAALPGVASAQEFSFNPPGTLTSGSGSGRFDEHVYAPNMRYPVEETPSFANSQVWGHGGGSGPGGGQCDIENFSYPWWDNYCETRSWDMPLCPSGTGHQGQDIRAKSCDKNVHWVVASEAGTVTNVGSYSVYITAADGTRYDYLHMGSVQVGVGDDVTKGQHIGKVSNEFGGTPTTVHLHFNLRQNVSGVGTVYVPPYMSLVTSYQALVGPVGEPPAGALDEVGCTSIRGWTQSPTSPEESIDVKLYFDGAPDDGLTVGHPFLADLDRDDLCTAIGSCNHAFEIPPPLSLFDGVAHPVHALASDGTSRTGVLANSPGTMTCPFEPPSGVRRKITDAAAANAWHFSPFWDEIEVSDGILASLDEGADLEASPRLVASASAPDTVWLVDRGKRRAVEGRVVALAWELDPFFAEVVPDAELAAIPEGPAVRSRPIVLRSASGDLWLVDDPAGAGPGGDGGGGSSDGGDDASLDDSAGCECSNAVSPRSALVGPFAVAFASLLLLRRRRRSA